MGAAKTFSLPLWTYDRAGRTEGWTHERLQERLTENRIVFHRAFGSQAIDLSSLTYLPVERWAKYQNVGEIPGIATCPIVGFLDPAPGKGRGDFSAICCLALGSDSRFYLLEAWLSQEAKPTDQIGRIFALHESYATIPSRGGHGFHAFGVETNVFATLYLDLFAQERETRRRAGRARWQVPLRGVDVAGKKEERILGLQSLIENGWLVAPEDAASRWPALFEQFEGFGPESTPAHDDGPDALASAVTLARQAQAGAGSAKAVGTRETAVATERY